MLTNRCYFNDQVLFFVHIFCWNNKYVLYNISRKGLEKTYIHFFNNTFPKDAVIIYGEFNLFIKIFNFNDRLKI